MSQLTLLSWNVNGIRSIRKKGFDDFLAKTPHDVLCLQEVRASREESNLDLPDTTILWNAAEKKGYAGTAILSKPKPLGVTFGMNIPDHDKEGRLITAEYDDFYLVTAYQPNSQRGLTRLNYRTQEWDPAFFSFLKRLERTKPVVACGDFNVAHKEIDLENPDSNHKSAGFTDEERAEFEKLIQHGFIDTFREFHAGGGHYTWWSNFSNCRARNIGWRVDYFLISEALRPRLLEATLLPQVMGSDHCPVRIVLKA